MTITGITSNGKIIVDIGGIRCIFDLEAELKYESYINIVKIIPQN